MSVDPDEFLEEKATQADRMKELLSLQDEIRRMSEVRMKRAGTQVDYRPSDLAQSVLRTMIRKVQDGRLHTIPVTEGLLFTAVKRKLIDAIRRAKAKIRGGDRIVSGLDLDQLKSKQTDPSPVEVLIRLEDHQQAFERLRAKEKDVVLLMAEDFTIPEIAEKLAEKPETLEKRVARMRLRLGPKKPE